LSEKGVREAGTCLYLCVILSKKKLFSGNLREKGRKEGPALACRCIGCRYRATKKLDGPIWGAEKQVFARRLTFSADGDRLLIWKPSSIQRAQLGALPTPATRHAPRAT